MFAIKVNEVDWELHEEGVDSLAWDDPHALTVIKTLSTQQSLGSLDIASSHFNPIGNLRVSRDVSD